MKPFGFIPFHKIRKLTVVSFLIIHFNCLVRHFRLFNFLTKNHLQNTTVTVVVNFNFTIETSYYFKLFSLPSRSVATTFTRSRGLTVLSIWISNDSLPTRPNVSALSPSLNWSGNTPINTKLLRWIRSKLSAITALIPNKFVPLQPSHENFPYRNLYQQQLKGLCHLLYIS